MATCHFPGCSKPVFTGSNYCSRTHRDASCGGSTQGAAGTCHFPGCSKPVFSGSNFCSKTHRDASSGGTTQGAAGTCHFPGCSKPVHTGSNFCSKTHRDASSGGSTQGAAGTCHFPGCSKPVHTGSNFCSKTHRDASSGGSTQGAAGTCHFPGCSKPVHTGSNFCSKTHRDAAKPSGSGASNGPGICKFPGCSNSVYTGSDYCSKTHRDNAPKGSASHGGPCLVEIPQHDAKFKNIENQFATKWEHNTKRPTVRHIYKITAPANKVSAYEAYRSSVSQSTGLSEGNQNRRFHGTNRMCTVGDGGCTTLCSSPQCSLCCIVKTSFKLNKAGGNKTWMGKKGGRFGLGIYTSATSSKANDYSENKGAYSNYKAFFLTKVVVGRAKKYTVDRPDLTEPPAGFHSVIGEPDTFGTLNYDELIVYREDAVIPAYLIVYDKP